MSKIKSIKARQILDSRGNPTVEVDVFTELGRFRASVPSGVSRGEREAIEIRDGGQRYAGMGVSKAVRNVNEFLGPRLVGKDPCWQKEIDELMIDLDGTNNKARFGVNAILPISLAVCRAGAAAQSLSLWQYLGQLFGNSRFSLPSPCLLVAEGGLHAGNFLDIQEFMIVTKAKSFQGRLRILTEAYKKIGEILGRKHGKLARNIGIEGGYAVPLRRASQVLDLILEAGQECGYDLEIIIDAAASHFEKEGLYRFEGVTLSSDGLFKIYQELIKKYPLLGIEDPFSENDWSNFKKMVKTFKSKLFVIGDDLLTTNAQQIKKAIKEKACNGLILKPNQVGTVTETLEAAKLAMKSGLEVFVKHRAGETNDSFIADLAVGIGAKYIMAGAPSKPERLAKYNRLLRIEQEMLKYS